MYCINETVLFDAEGDGNSVKSLSFIQIRPDPYDSAISFIFCHDCS